MFKPMTPEPLPSDNGLSDDTIKNIGNHIQHKIIEDYAVLEALCNPLKSRDEITVSGDGRFIRAYVMINLELNINNDKQFYVELFKGRGDDVTVYIHHPLYKTSEVHICDSMNNIVRWCMETIKNM